MEEYETATDTAGYEDSGNQGPVGTMALGRETKTVAYVAP